MRVYSLLAPNSHLSCCIRSATVAWWLRRNLYLLWSWRVLHVTSMPVSAAVAMPVSLFTVSSRSLLCSTDRVRTFRPGSLQLTHVARSVSNLNEWICPEEAWSNITIHFKKSFLRCSWPNVRHPLWLKVHLFMMNYSLVPLLGKFI